MPGKKKTEDDTDEVPLKRSDMEAFLTSFLAKNGGDEKRALQQLADETFTLRRRVQKWKGRAEELEEKLPEGHTAVSADDAKLLTEFKELKLTPKQAQEAIAKRDELQSEVTKRDQATSHAAAAAAIGYNAEALTSLAQDKKLRIEMREVEVEAGGKREKKQIPHVITGEGASAKVERLTEYAERDLKPYLPALKAAAPGTTPTSTQQAPTGVRYPSQSTDQGTPAASGDIVADTIARNAAERANRPSPFKPQGGGTTTTR